MISTSPISCNIVSVEKFHAAPVEKDRDMGPIGMPIGARDLSCDQAM